ncbi:hypothetical protein [Shimia sagamensis]|uniref:Uncharacterized protein n=1 Tax=Shimia sagamensis TaxID=1566352 RepID=A0ABY1NR75_9RHOB|nr:hypothetical protein [Shimia sagamensis]SMP16084.1 hypothetical protein SAMN06265373_1037 [Shimia sagamensis]
MPTTNTKKDRLDIKTARLVDQLKAVIAEQKSVEELRKVECQKAILATFEAWLTKAPDAVRFPVIQLLSETATKRNKALIEEFLDGLNVNETVDEEAEEKVEVLADKKMGDVPKSETKEV